MHVRANVFKIFKDRVKQMFLSSQIVMAFYPKMLEIQKKKKYGKKMKHGNIYIYARKDFIWDLLCALHIWVFYKQLRVEVRHILLFVYNKLDKNFTIIS